MWAQKVVIIAVLISRLAMALFTLDILAWTFGLTIIPPLDALLRLGIWCVPSLLPLFLPSFCKFLNEPVKVFQEACAAEWPSIKERIIVAFKESRMEVVE